MASRFLLRALFAIGSAAIFALGALAAEKTPRDSAPELISVDGPKWKNDRDLERYAELGDPLAQYQWAERLLNGDGATRDVPRAVALLEKSAQAGNGDAAFRLGKLYHDGAEVTRDFTKSFAYYADAARQNVPEAMHNLGAMLVSARGVKRDYVEGLAWLIVAEKSGAVSTAEQQTRVRLAKRPEIVAQAEARAKEILTALRDPKQRVEVRAVFQDEPSSPTAGKPVAPTRDTPSNINLTPAPKPAAPKVEIEIPKPQLDPK